MLNRSELDALARGAVAVTFHKGRIIREDEPGASMFVVTGGEVAVTSGSGAAAKRVATLSPVAIIGEMSLLTGARRSANVDAVSDVTALEIGKHALEPILSASPALVDRFAEMLKRRQKELDRAYGGGRAFGFSRDNFADLIRGFFGGTL